MAQFKLSTSFQFQSGAVKSIDVSLNDVKVIKFQFQSGAVKSRDRLVCIKTKITDFNSKVVRLKVRCWNHSKK